MRDEKEGRKKQARSNKQGKATQHIQGSHFSHGTSKVFILCIRLMTEILIVYTLFIIMLTCGTGFIFRPLTFLVMFIN